VDPQHCFICPRSNEYSILLSGTPIRMEACFINIVFLMHRPSRWLVVKVVFFKFFKTRIPPIRLSGSSSLRQLLCSSLRQLLHLGTSYSPPFRQLLCSSLRQLFCSSLRQLLCSSLRQLLRSSTWVPPILLLSGSFSSYPILYVEWLLIQLLRFYCFIL
jgi:hypothetical protein